VPAQEQFAQPVRAIPRLDRGQEVVIDPHARRFFCSNPACAKATFAEQVPGLTTRYGRRACTLQAVLQAAALALGAARPDYREAVAKLIDILSRASQAD
jgi:hypothetical protein